MKNMKLLSYLLAASLLSFPLSAEVKLGEELVRGDLHVIVKKTTMVTWNMFNLTPKGILTQIWSTESTESVYGYTIVINYLDNNGKARRLVDFAPVNATLNFILALTPIDLATVGAITSVEVIESRLPVKAAVFE